MMASVESHRKEPLRVGYIYSDEYSRICGKFEKATDRAPMVHELIKSYDLFDAMKIIPPKPASRKDLQRFHSSDYVETLMSSPASDSSPSTSDSREDHGFDGTDCSWKEGIGDYAALVAGGSLTAVDSLLRGDCDVVFNWGGGWHHAAESKASGFCYINDCVLSLLKLEEKLGTVLYIDLDVHHGDGVQDAFYTTQRVATVSFHHYSAGYFPGTGGMEETGSGRGELFNVNVPLQEGATDSDVLYLIEKIFPSLKNVYRPKAVVLQCGADGLARDPLGAFNLTEIPFCHALATLLQWHVPILVLGGGGYDAANTARCWTLITASVLNRTLCEDISGDYPFFCDFGPSYTLELLPGRIRNKNTREKLDEIADTVQSMNLSGRSLFLNKVGSVTFRK